MFSRFHPRFLRTTHRNPVLYWFVGSTLIFLILPLNLVDIVIAPWWHAPHWQCDSIGVPIIETTAVIVPWAGVSFMVSAALAIPSVWRRQGGADIFEFSLGKSFCKWLVTAGFGVLFAFFLYPVAVHFWNAILPQTITADCNGSADPITLVMRGPLLQFVPVCELAIAVWLLHLRALALSSRTNVSA